MMALVLSMTDNSSHGTTHSSNTSYCRRSDQQQQATQQQQYVHRCPFVHCQQHSHGIHCTGTDPDNIKNINTSSNQVRVPPPHHSSVPADTWPQALSMRGPGATEDGTPVTDAFRSRVVNYIVDQLSNGEEMQAKHARERLRRSVSTLESTVYNTTPQKEYLKMLAAKLSAVYQQLQKESSTCCSRGCNSPSINDTTTANCLASQHHPTK